LFCFAKRLRRTRLQRFYEPQAGAQSYGFVSASGLCDVGAGARGKIREQRDDQDAHDWDGGLAPYRSVALNLDAAHPNFAFASVQGCR